MYKQKDFEGMEYNPLAVPPGIVIWRKYPRLARRPLLCRTPKVILKDLNFDEIEEEVEIDSSKWDKIIAKEEQDGYVDDNRRKKGPTPSDKMNVEMERVSRYKEIDVSDMVRFSLLFIVRAGNPIGAIRDFDERMEMCFEILGMKKGHKVRTLVEQNHWWFQVIMLEIFKMEHDMDYEVWFSQKMLFHTQTKLLRSNIGTGDVEGKAKARGIVSNSLDALRDKIRTIEFSLFPDAKTAARIKDAATSDALGLYAERFARDFHNDPQVNMLEGMNI